MHLKATSTEMTVTMSAVTQCLLLQFTSCQSLGHNLVKLDSDN